MVKPCVLCPHTCGVDRRTQKGICGIGINPVLAKAVPHHWEEPCISGTRGSGTVFFSGCSLRCCFCQNHPISQDGIGWEMTVPELAAVLLRLSQQAVHNINLVNPVHQADSIAKALDSISAQLNIPVIWNSSGYDAVDTISMMASRVAVWLPDLKFFDTSLSSKLAGAPDYFLHASKAICRMAELAEKPHYDADGLITKGLIIRHLVLPGHTNDSVRLLEWIAANFGDAIPISLMAQYTPMPHAVDAPSRRLSAREYDKVLEHFFRLGLSGYIQEREASGHETIPVFDGEGLFL